MESRKTLFLISAQLMGQSLVKRAAVVQGAAAVNAESDNARVIAEQAGHVAKFR